MYVSWPFWRGGNGGGIKARLDSETIRDGISTFVNAKPRDIFNEKWEHLAAMFV